MLLYLRQEGRGIGLLNKIKAYQLQDNGADTVEANEQLGFAADLRDYSICTDMLAHLRIQSLRLMTNNPRKVKALSACGVDVVERLPIEVGRNPHNDAYLSTKASKLGHWLANHQDDELGDSTWSPAVLLLFLFVLSILNNLLSFVHLVARLMGHRWFGLVLLSD